MANVKFYTVDLKQKYLDLEKKETSALYWIEETQELYKGKRLFGTGQTASEKAAGLLSASDYAKLQNLINGVALQDAAPGQVPFMGAEGKLVWSNVVLRRDNYFNYKSDFVPLNGEICLVDTARDGLRAICGDGVTAFADLEYLDNFIIQGYLNEGEFYKDKSNTQLITGRTHKLYIDMNSHQMYVFDGASYIEIGGDKVANASATVAGIMKLYDTVGQNTDGTITQRLFTDEINQKFEMDVVPEDEMLVFDHDIN